MASCSSALWIINSQETDLQDPEQAFLIELHCAPARARQIGKRRRAADRRHMLLSHLLQRHACVELGKIRPEQVKIERTKGGKPFAAVAPAAHCPNFNFNASHDGDYVVIGASTHFLTGVDVHQIVPASQELDHLEALHTPKQRAQAELMQPADRWIWSQALFSLKEAYTKAIGVGLGQSFDQIEFEPALPADWARQGACGGWRGTVHHMGEERTSQGEWCLERQWPDQEHILTSATGDVAKAVDANGHFASRLTQPGLSPASVEEGSLGLAKRLCLYNLLTPTEQDLFDREFFTAPDSPYGSSSDSDGQSEIDVEDLLDLTWT